MYARGFAELFDLNPFNGFYRINYPEETIERPVDKKEISFLERKLERFSSIWCGDKPKHHNCPEKCEFCRYKSGCMFSLSK